MFDNQVLDQAGGKGNPCLFGAHCELGTEGFLEGHLGRGLEASNP